MRKSESEASAANLSAATLSDKEIDIIQRLGNFPSVVEQAAGDYNPSCIATYCYELAKAFNQFYHDYSILHEENSANRALRIELSKAVAQNLRNGMSLLGIEMPERM